MSDDKINKRYVKKESDDTDFNWVMSFLIYNVENPDFNTPSFRDAFRKLFKDTMELDRSDRTIQRWCNDAIREVKRSQGINQIHYGVSINSGGMIKMVQPFESPDRLVIKDEHVPLINQAIGLYQRYARYLPSNFSKYKPKPTWSWGIWADKFLRQVGTEGIEPLDVLIMGEYLNERYLSKEAWDSDSEWGDIYSWLEHMPFRRGEMEDAYLEGLGAEDIEPLKRLFPVRDYGTFVIGEGSTDTGTQTEGKRFILDGLTDKSILRYGFKLIVEMFMGLGEGNIPFYWLPSQKKKSYLEWCESTGSSPDIHFGDTKIKL